jgi:hypothetical protein
MANYDKPTNCSSQKKMTKYLRCVKSPKIYLLIIISIISIFSQGCARQVTKKTQEILPTISPSTRTEVIKIPTRENNNHEPIILFEGEITLRTVINNAKFNSFVDLDTQKEGKQGDLLSDLQFNGSGGTSIFFTIKPINGVKGFSSNQGLIDYKYCLDNIPLYSEGSLPEFLSGLPICVLTNERRMAILQYKENSFVEEKDGYISVVILVRVWESSVISPK